MDTFDRRRFLAFAAALSAASTVRAGTGLNLLPPAPPPDQDDGLTFRVLAIHDVRDDLHANPTTVSDTCAISTATLNTIFAWIKAQDFHPVSVAQIIASRNGGPRLPSRPILLSFDDAYKSQYTKVFPLLEQYGYPGLIGVVTRWTDTPRGQPLRISAKSLMPPGYFMNWDDLREMASSGLVELASHTHDMHHGALANPQGNELPAASAHLYLQDRQRYETDDEYHARIHGDLKRSIDLIRQQTGVAVRSMVWPYGMYNDALIDTAQTLGMEAHFTLNSGPNTPDVPLTKVRRLLVSYDWDVGTMISQMRTRAAYRGEHHPVERVVDVALDEVYDAVPAKREDKLSRLLDRIKDLGPKSVYLRAYADPDGTGVAQALYFPNRHMPMRADLFNRVAWQLMTRAGVEVYARLPMLAFALPAGHPAAGQVVAAATSADAAGRAGAARVPRLSPFDDAARDAIGDIYDDLTKYTSFNGLVFNADATLADDEDASAPALAAYAKWGLPADVGRIRASNAMMQTWSRAKTDHLIAFSLELTDRVRAYQGGGNVLTARILPADAALRTDGDARSRYAQSLGAFVADYDFVVLAAQPAEGGGNVSATWLGRLARAVAAHPGAVQKTVFELQAVDRHTRQPIATETLRQQMQLLNAAGIVHLGYTPDDFLANRPDTVALRDVMSTRNVMRMKHAMQA